MKKIIVCFLLLSHLSFAASIDSSDTCSPEQAPVKGFSEVAQEVGQTIAPVISIVTPIIPLLLGVLLESKVDPYISKERVFLKYLSSGFFTSMKVALGAPIWTPLSSTVQKAVFALSNWISPNSQESSAMTFKQSRLAAMWPETQASYSMNEQMSRNVLNALTASINANLSAAKSALDSGKVEYAAAQIADAVIRMKELFAEVHPSDVTIARLVRERITHSTRIPDEFVELVIKHVERIYKNEHVILNDEMKAYFHLLLNKWFK